MNKTTLPSRNIILFSFATLALLCASASVAQTPAPAPTPASVVTISLDTANVGAAIPADYTGLSFEGSLLMPDKKTSLRVFRSDNKPLLQLFKTLNVKSLRIGGNTSDRDAVAMPSEADIDSLFAFAKASNTKVIYCLRLFKSTPEEAAKTASYIMDRYADLMQCFAIGQEPSAYPKPPKTGEAAAKVGMGEGFENNSYASYAANWKKFAAAVLAAAPNAKFCGPAVHNNGAWAKLFMRDFAKTHPVVLIVEHLYPGGAGGKVLSPEVGISQMLSDKFIKACEKLHDSFVPETLANHLPYRIEETSNYYNGGAADVSNTYASALWGLDYMWWWATHDAAGLNFHTGDNVAAGPDLVPSKYTAYVSAPDGYYVRPLGYGIKAFALGSHGKLIPATVTNADNLNLNVYATQTENGDLTITIINKEHAAGARDADLTINLNTNAASYKTAKTMTLAAPNNDITAKADITLGGAPIKNDGTWSGAWTPAPAPTDGKLRLKAPASSATVLLVTREE